MTGLDSNILIRYFAQDDARQAKKATEIVEKRLSRENPGFIATVVVVEMAWVLQRLYQVKVPALMEIVEQLLSAEELKLQHREEVWKAWQLVTSEKIDFADALIGLIHKAEGCEVTLTFDRKAAKNGLFELA